MKDKKILFSIIIPTYNGKKWISKLLTKLHKIITITNYNTEVIIIDSESKDGTFEEVLKFKNKLNLKVYRIKKEEFNHGLTRNLGVKLSKGKYVWFLSQDALPRDNNILNYFIEDFNISKRVVAIYGPHIPYPNTPIIQKIEFKCFWKKIDKFLSPNENRLILDPAKRTVPVSSENLGIWFRLSNTSCVYRRSFLKKNFFPKTNFGEDILIGKKIFDLKLIKIYDKRCAVLHSHKFNFKKYLDYEKKFLYLRYFKLKLKDKPNFLCKFKLILKEDLSFPKRIFYIFKLLLYYILKIYLLIKSKV